MNKLQDSENKMRLFALFLLLIFSGCAALIVGEKNWVTDDYFFNKLHEKRTYTLRPESFSRPEIVLIDNACTFPSNIFEVLPNGNPSFAFQWEIMAEVIKNGRVVERKLLTPSYATFRDRDCISVIAFEPLKSISDKPFPGEVKIVITVNKTDVRFLNVNGGVKFRIRNSTQL